MDGYLAAPIPKTTSENSTGCGPILGFGFDLN
jgi:hypothetical protein